MAQLTIANDESELAHLAAGRLTQLIVDATARSGSALVSLTGGSTPRQLYSALADACQPWRGRIPWSQVRLCWGDERHVPPDHPDSNYGMARAALIDHVSIPADHVHRIRGEMPDARAAAADYEHTLDVVSAFRRTFDVMLLGVGEDAHIASIFPGSELLEPDARRLTGREDAAGRPFTGREDAAGRPFTGCEDAAGRPFTGRRVAAVWAAHLNAWRITLTPHALLDSQAIVVLVAGASKAAAVHAALNTRLDVNRYPAQLLRAADDRVEWLLDRSAAALL